jgi:hypothetical protein
MSALRPSVADIMLLAQCELGRALRAADARNPGPQIPNSSWGIKITLIAKIVGTAGGTGSADVDFIVLNGLDTLLPGITLGLTRTSTLTRTYVSTPNRDELATLALNQCAALNASDQAHRFVNDFGLMEWVAASGSMPLIDGLSTGFDFTVKAEASLRGVFSIVPAKGSVGGSLSRSDTHTLTIALEPPAAPSPAPPARGGRPAAPTASELTTLTLEAIRNE